MWQYEFLTLNMSVFVMEMSNCCVGDWIYSIVKYSRYLRRPTMPNAQFWAQATLTDSRGFSLNLFRTSPQPHHHVLHDLNLVTV